MTRAGDLDERIQLQSASVANDAVYNEPVETWGTYATVWAQVRYLSEGERVSADKWFAEQELSFRVRYRDDVAPGDRIVFREAMYEVRGRPRPLGRQHFMDIPARRIDG